ncbi:MAG: FHA domain-containing protein [Planctomycetes bacterium]|nr:FHA domain-containing protein [Planctomycetota bacterium]
MAAPLFPSAAKCMVIHLLDSAQGNTLQAWRFSNHEIVTIGRDANNDIVAADPQVSRSHARLVQQNDNWTLFSTGRHGTLINDRLVTEAVLQPQTVFRLGASGPMLRFDVDTRQPHRSETLENIDTDLIASLAVDEQRKQREVDQIAENTLFRELQERSRQLRKSGGQTPESS